jgi:hypothetical protein
MFIFITHRLSDVVSSLHSPPFKWWVIGEPQFKWWANYILLNSIPFEAITNRISP